MAGQNTRFGGTFEQAVDVTELLQVRRDPHVTMFEFHARFGQAR